MTEQSSHQDTVTPSLDPGSVLQVPSHVVFRRTGDEGVLLDLEKGTYFGLNELGRALWELLATGCSLGEVHDALLGRYDVEPDHLRRDLDSHVAELLRLGLLHR